MIEESWDIELGDNTYAVPRLPFKYSMRVYPICQRLSNADLAERILVQSEPLQLIDSEIDDLGVVAFLLCCAANSEMTQAAFDNMPITPPQLFDAFFAARKACGGWRTLAEGQEPSGESLGTEEPPT